MGITALAGIDEIRKLRDLRRLPELLLCGVGFAHADVFFNGAGIDCRALQNAADSAAQGVLAQLRGGDAVQKDLTLRRETETEQEGNEGAFAAAGAADHGDLLPRKDFQGDVADRGFRAAVGERDVLKADAAGQNRGLPDIGVAHAFGVHDLSDTLRGDFRMGEHDNAKGGHDHTVHDHGDILNDGKDVARTDTAGSADHLPAAEIDDQDDCKIQNKRGDRQQRSHGYVAADDVFRHDMRCVRDAVMLVLFGIEGADDTDAAQALAHDAVLLVDVQIRFLPQGKHMLAGDPAAQQNDRDDRQKD